MKRIFWIIIGLIMVGVSIVAIATILIEVLGEEVEAKTPQDQGEAFPVVAGENLNGDEINVPIDLPTPYKLIVIAYEGAQQLDVNDWLGPLEELSRLYPDLGGYYLLLFPKDIADTSEQIVFGMRLVVREDKDRTRTILAFTDVDQFNQFANIPDKTMIRLFLLDKANRVIWNESGVYTDEKLGILQEELEALPHNE
jgi:hypothetical protein